MRRVPEGTRRALVALLLFWAPALFAAGTPAVATVSTVDGEQWSDRYDDLFRKYAASYFGPHFDWRWFKAQAIAESRLKAGAASHAGAQGVMQILPSTFRDLQRDQPHFGDLASPQWNIAAGIYYDSRLFRRWRGLPEQERLYLAFASYNAGYQRVREAYLRVPEARRSWSAIRRHLPPETRAYVERIRALMEEAPQGARLLRLTALFAE